MGFGSSYKRWRHTRGYGVHSPFAYRMVREVVRPRRGYGYYAYADIDNALVRPRLPHTRRHARMLLRLAATLRVRSAFIPNDNSTSPFRIALRGADSRIKVTTALADACNCDLLASNADFVPLGSLTAYIRRPGTTLCLRSAPDGWADAISEAMPRGVLLYSRDALIAIHNPDVEKVSYSVRL